MRFTSSACEPHIPIPRLKSFLLSVIRTGVYTIPIQYSTAMATITTSAEIIKPCTIGAIPAFFISLKLVFKPMAARAQTISSLLKSLAAVEIAAGINPRLLVIASARKPVINHGKMLRILKLVFSAEVFPFAIASFFFIFN